MAGLLLKPLPGALWVQSVPHVWGREKEPLRAPSAWAPLQFGSERPEKPNYLGELGREADDQALQPSGPAAGGARAALPSGPPQRAGRGGYAPAGLGLRTDGSAPAPGPAPLPHGRARVLQLLPLRAPQPHAAVQPHQLRPRFL